MISNICLGLVTIFHFLANQSTQVEKCFKFLQTFFLSAIVTSSERTSYHSSWTEDYTAVYGVKLIVAQVQDLVSDSGKVGVKWNMKEHTNP